MFSAARRSTSMSDQSSGNDHDNNGGSHNNSPRKNRRQWTDLVEELLNAARDRGEFENLEGTGRPLALDQNPYAGDRALAYSLLKNNEFAPPEIERGKEIDGDIKRAENLLDTLRRHQHALRGRASQRDARHAYNIARDATLARYEALLGEINSKILSLNIVAPTVMHRRRLDIETKLREFREEFPRLEE
jgi:DnaJ family protein C protein 28